MKRIGIVFLVLLASCSTAPVSRPVTAPTVPQPPPTSPNRLTPMGTVSRAITEPRIRVGLLSDQPSATFERIPDGYYVISDAGPSIIRRGFTVNAPLSGASVHYAVQAGALSDSTSATALAEKAGAEMTQRVNQVFDPASGLYKVLVGDFEDNASAIPLRNEMILRGYPKDMSIVRRPAGQRFTKQHQVVDDEGDRYTIGGDSILIVPVSADTLVIGDKPYRTAARLFINARGLFNVINELNLEDYLYGVVPAEMGPKIFDELEALKAQAIAARTYAIRNMGQFRSEGYDICPGPACQAYNGFSGEDALSNQAVKESAGLIITYDGKPIDALYTATCGGETSDVSTMFPGRSEPYLKRARCVELDIVTVTGRADSAPMTEQQANGRLFTALVGLPELGTSWSARDVEAAVQAAFRYIGATMPSGAQAASSRRGDVLRYLAATMGLDDKARVLTMPEDRRYFFPQAANPEDVPYLAAAFLVKYGVLPAQEIDRIDLNAAMPRDELHALLGAWVREHSVVLEASGKIYGVNGRKVTLKSEGRTTSYTLPENVPIFRRLGDRYQEYREVPIMAGDRATIFQSSRKMPVAMIVQANFDGASFDRTSSFANWTRSYRAEELVPVMNRRNPIQQLVDIRPLVVDASKRIAELEVTAENGRTFVLKGLPVRWSLNVPDNLFVYEKTKDPDGMDRYTFFGKGWGHGTGFCQVGSYGMAFRGWTYERILKNFYTGVEIVPMSSVSTASARGAQ